jgi:hypothetical protein
MALEDAQPERLFLIYYTFGRLFARLSPDVICMRGLTKVIGRRLLK